MTLKGCPREQEIRQLVEHGRRALDGSPELTAHVEGCRSCADLVLVGNAFQTARAQSSASARLVPPGILWWRAQLRRRNAAVELLARPLLSAQIFALAVTLVAGAGFVTFEARQGGAWISWLEQILQYTAQQWNHLRLAMFADPGWSMVVLLPVFGTLAVLGGAAVYLAADRH